MLLKLYILSTFSGFLGGLDSYLLFGLVYGVFFVGLGDVGFPILGFVIGIIVIIVSFLILFFVWYYFIVM